jgi:CBS domain-containing protein
MDDALALFLFAIASSCVSIIMGLHDLDLKHALLVPVHEILGAITIGVVFGWVLCKILVKTFNEDKVLIISLGGLLLIVGLALTLHMDMILASMVAGTFISNKVPVISKKAFRIIKGITPPIYVLFFILVGAKLDLSLLNKSLALASLVYIVSRFIGKASGAWFGAKISKAELSVQKYLPFCLLSQAGVAIGLSIIAFNTFPNEIGSTIIAIITASTFVVQLIGPILTKYAITQAKEVGKDCSEDDFLEINTAKDFMNPHPKCVLQKEGYTQIIHMFKDDGLLVYPVIDSDNKIAGLITIESLKHILMEASMLDLIVADDLMVPVTTIITPTTTAKQIKFLFSEHRFYGLPVIGDNEEFLGFIYAREFFSKLSQKFIEQVTP